MDNIKKGDMVGRKSYGKDVIFKVKRIINTKQGKMAILRGITERVEADSVLDDLEVLSKEEIRQSIKKWDEKLENRIQQANSKSDLTAKLERYNKRSGEEIVTGKILHLDGDKRYSEKSNRYYKKLGLNAVVKNIPESKQPMVIYNMLMYYNPDILVITGHERRY